MTLKSGLLAAAILLAGLLGVSSLQGQDLVLNGKFETEEWKPWDLTGNLPSANRFVTSVDVAAPGAYSWCYGQVPWTNNDGGLSQTIHVQAGVTYTVSLDICYESC